MPKGEKGFKTGQDGQIGRLPFQVLADQLNLSQPEGADYVPLLLHAHPALGSFLRHWMLSDFEKRRSQAVYSIFKL